MPWRAGRRTMRALAAAVSRALGDLGRGCRTLTSDLRVRIAATGLTTYPDVTVVCGKTERAVDEPLAVTKPALLAEVTRPSTVDYDRGEKLRNYRELASDREVLIVSHRGPHVTVHRREASGWVVLERQAGESVELSSVGATFDVNELYRDGLEDLSTLPA